MAADSPYHEGMRQLQDARDSRRIADRLAEVTLRQAFTAEDRQFIERAAMLFVATADAHGHPDCSYKGGLPGFVRVLDDTTLAFPDYDGNGMYRTWGNVIVNPHVGLLFPDFENQKRIRVNGTATISADDPLIDSFEGAAFVVRVSARAIFPNCPRYLHRMQLVEYSAYAPSPGHSPPEPAWKRNAAFCDHLPARDKPGGAVES